MVALNCGECGAWPAVSVSPSVVDGVVSCSVCGAGVDVGHAFGHARWCVVCGDDVNYCECGEVV